MFGEGYYASAFALVGHGQMHAWWGTYGISATVGAGPIFASRKRTSGWDGLLAGLVVEASPVRLRFDAFEPSLDVGFLYAVGNDYPAPYVLPSLTYHL
jgi:hypothetical protein